jgi:hypothetical protein
MHILHSPIPNLKTETMKQIRRRQLELIKSPGKCELTYGTKPNQDWNDKNFSKCHLDRTITFLYTYFLPTYR